MKIILWMDNYLIHTLKIWWCFLNYQSLIAFLLSYILLEYATFELLFNMIKKRFLNKWKELFMNLKSNVSIKEQNICLDSFMQKDVISFWTKTKMNIS